MYYTTEGSGTPVLLLHGYGVDHRVMQGCFEPVFAKAPGSYQRFYVDLPGMGKTPAEGVESADDMLGAIQRFIAREMPEGPFLLAGQSYGGYMAQGLLAGMPQRIAGAALICPVVLADRAARTVPPHRVLQDSLGPIPQDALGEGFDSFAVVRTEESLRRYANEVWPGIQAADSGFISSFVRRRYQYQNAPNLQSFTGPSLVVAGRQDATVGYRDMAPLLEALPRAAFAVLDMAGHNLQLERPALFEALCVDWLERVALAGGEQT